MIEGVVVKKITKHSDERGFFAEISKFGEDNFHEIMQVSYSETKPGVIKAFHVHDYWEVWCIIKGQAKVVLYDLRDNSSTKNQTEVIFAGEDNMLVIAIPGEVAHGYTPVGSEVMGIIYLSSEVYNPKNITIRSIPFNDLSINFDWTKS